MAPQTEDFTIGVEEEYQIINPTTRKLSSRAKHILPIAQKALGDYQALVQALVETKSVEEATKIYWNVRLSERFPTIEFRVTDVCMSVDDAELMDIGALAAVPAREMVDKFLAFVRPSLEDSGEWEEISSIVDETMQQGNGATRQREAYLRAGRLEDIVDLIVKETAKGIV